MCKNKKFSHRYVFNSSCCRKNVVTECRASTRDWIQWFNESNSYKPVVPGKSFADVVRANLGQKGQGQAAPLVGTQVASIQGEPLGLFKEDVQLSSNLSHHAKNSKARGCKTSTTHQNQNVITCSNRFEPLMEENLLLDEFDMYDHDIQAVDTISGDTGHSCSLPQNVNLQNYDNFDQALAKKRVDLSVIQEMKNCRDYVACKSQMGESFGVVPLGNLRTYRGPETKNQHISDPLQLHKIVGQFGCPNFLGARIPVVSKLNIDIWKFYLHEYWDQQLVDLLEFGFPLDFDKNTVLVSTEDNHASARHFSSHVQTYIQEELKHGAMLGPFDHKPIPLHVSPFMTRDKADSDTRRTIVDLSWPKGQSVNSGVQKSKYLGTEFILNYPSVDDIVKRVIRLGPGSLLCKIDISRAFRQLKVDPGDINLLGLKLDSYYIDQSVPFGYRHGSIFFEKVTDSIRYIMRKHGFPDLFNYVDDIIYCGTPSEITPAFKFLTHLIHQLGLDINPKKLVAPTTSMICLGILVDTRTRTMSVPPEKLQNIARMCVEWQNKKFCSKRELQSLLGSLLYVSKCVKPARTFLNRMLQFLRSITNDSATKLTAEFCKDLNWFRTFIHQFNGVVYYDLRPVQAELHLDACLTGFGGIFDNQCYALPIPKNFKNYSIVHLEMLNIVVALKIWAQQWSSKKLRIKCDNMAVVEVLTSGRARDPILALCARNVWLISAIYNISIHIEHIPGKNNVIADLLSRFKFDAASWQALSQQVPNYVWIDTHIDLTELNTTL